MAHRDPETGQFVSDGDGGISYSDHDVHHVVHEFGVDGESNPQDLSNTQRFEITERGLDPDEIAELRVMNLHIGTRYEYNGTSTGMPVMDYRLDTGYNLGDGEFTDGGQTVTGLDPDGDSTDEFKATVNDTDEVGELYHERDTVVGPSLDDSNSNGNGGSFRQETITVNMADLFGSGPFVDSADDFVSRIFLNPNRINGELGIMVSYSLYYNVMKTETGRSRFGR